MMKFKNFMFVALLAVPMFAHAATKALTQEDVERILHQVDEASMQKDVNLLAEIASEKAVFVYHVSLDGESRSSRATKSEYLSNLRRGWSEYQSYEYVRNNASISIDNPKKATVKTVVTEYITIDGQSIEAVTHETVTIEIVRGKPLITKVVGYVNLELMTIT